MTMDIASLGGLTAMGYGAGFAACAILGTWLLARRDRYGQAGIAIVGGLILTALWSMVALAEGPDSLALSFAESLRNLGWLFATYRLFASDGRHESVHPDYRQ